MSVYEVQEETIVSSRTRWTQDMPANLNRKVFPRSQRALLRANIKLHEPGDSPGKGRVTNLTAKGLKLNIGEQHGPAGIAVAWPGDPSGLIGSGEPSGR